MATHKRSGSAQNVETAGRVTAGTTAGVTEHAQHAGASVARGHQREISASSTVAQLSLGFATIAAVTPAHIAPPSATPKRAAKSGGVRQRFGELRAALADGWEIVQPIFARPLWSVSDDSTTAFNFVLRRERTTRLLTVPEGRTVERFIRDQQLMVDYRR